MRTVLRTGKRAMATVIARAPRLERGWVRFTRAYPGLRLSCSLAAALGDAYAHSPCRFRRVTLRPGAYMAIGICDVFSRIYFLGGGYQRETSELVRHVLRPGDVAFHLGAHAGYFHS